MSITYPILMAKWFSIQKYTQNFKTINTGIQIGSK